MSYQWEKFEKKWFRIQMLDVIVNTALVLATLYFIGKLQGWV